MYVCMYVFRVRVRVNVNPNPENSMHSLKGDSPRPRVLLTSLK